jgi:Tfp pilus assembly protein PilF
MRKMDKKAFSLILLVPLFLVFTRCATPVPQSQLHFGILAAQRNLWDEAIFRWKKAVELDPDSAAAHNNLAVAYEQKGLLKEAEKEYKLALELNPKNEYIQANYEKFKQGFEDPNEEEDEKKKDEKKKL